MIWTLLSCGIMVLLVAGMFLAERLSRHEEGRGAPHLESCRRGAAPVRPPRRTKQTRGAHLS